MLSPFTISWSAVTDPAGIIAYNWQVSTTSTFASVQRLNSTSGATQDVMSGLAAGTYFWHVQAVNGAFVSGAWSAVRSFTVTGVAPGALAAPVLGPTKGYTTFHPLESVTFNWSAVPGATTYVLDANHNTSYPFSAYLEVFGGVQL